jgi:hypothetical protein
VPGTIVGASPGHGPPHIRHMPRHILEVNMTCVPWCGGGRGKIEDVWVGPRLEFSSRESSGLEHLDRIAPRHRSGRGLSVRT